MAGKATQFGLRCCFVISLLITIEFWLMTNQLDLANASKTDLRRGVFSQGVKHRKKRSIIRSCKNRASVIDKDAGYQPLTKKDIQVQFINKSNIYIARVKWITPKGNNKRSIGSYYLIWLTTYVQAPRCVVLMNTTNEFDITEKPFSWKWNWALEIIILPQPSKTGKSGVHTILFEPIYNDPASVKSTMLSYNQTTVVSKVGTINPETKSSLAQSNRLFLPKATAEEGDVLTNKMKLYKIVASLAFAGVAVTLVLIGVIVFYRHRKNKNPPQEVPKEKCYTYVSYCPGNKCLVKKVVEFTSWFRQQGYDVQMDILQSPNNDAQLKELGPFRFGEKQIGKAKNVFMILSASYLKLCKLDEDGEIDIENLSSQERIVYSEITQIRNDLCSTVYRNSRFIPVIFGVKEIELPFWIKELVVYTWPDDKLNNRLLYRLNEQKEYAIAGLEL